MGIGGKTPKGGIAMFRQISVALAAVLALGLAGCESGRYSSSGFRLPTGGNVERGKAAFQSFASPPCHEAPGSALPRPTVQPPVPVVLGGTVARPFSDGYLVTSIIHPSYQLARYPVAEITAGGQ